MKHIKPYKESFNPRSVLPTNENLLIMRDIYQDFLDKFNITGEHKISSKCISLYSTGRSLQFGITLNGSGERGDTVFGKGFKINISADNGQFTQRGNFKGFDGIRNTSMKSELEKAYEICMDYFNFKDCLVGSSYIHIGEFILQ